ncbi:HAMP domain-containing sensor histidine kinase [Jeotgalibacillus sp. ET6]|uniref:sensor histidine kinase n=1 Tax=Jeotgalibacillus sp. ET6 TaxID=3037260 RepID=UPI0024183202|nr:HAMP domain-containing sensor histidine kinase [Jeotgalibacillus sp. ET6]MDG5472556.1 HAMP domain-containing sensor histidine kinase [Jeotgalibacillus sp. ET6]
MDLYKWLHHTYVKHKEGFTITVLIALIFVLNYLTNPGYDRIEVYIQEGLVFQNSAKIVLGSFLLVLVDGIREFPIFFTAWAVSYLLLKRVRAKYRIYTLGSIILGIYTLLFFSYFNVTAWITPAIIYLLGALIIYPMFRQGVSYLKQGLVMFQIIWSLQWLDLNPYWQNAGIARLGLVNEIYSAATLMGIQDILLVFSYVMGLPILFSAFITSLFFALQQQRFQTLQSINDRNVQLQTLKIQALKHRGAEEMHQLVHDLKTPLTAIQGLVSLLPLKNDQASISIYANRIERSLEHLNNMISEILYEEKTAELTIQQLVDSVKPQISGVIPSDILQFRIQKPDLLIEVNRIKMSRVFVNLLQNAYEATKKVEKPFIIVYISEEMINETNKKRGILIEVSDNGTGISKEFIHSIWDSHMSAKGQTGLGLAFVKKTVQQYGGWVKATSDHEGTDITLFLPTKEQSETHE